MPEDAVNPYAPPLESGAPAEEDGPPFRVEGEWLLARDGTHLPEVDLDGRDKGGTLTPMGLGFAVLGAKGGGPRSSGLLLLGFLPSVLMGLLFLLRLFDRISLGALVGGVMLCFLLSLRMRTPGSMVSLRGYASLPALRLRERGRRRSRAITRTGCGIVILAGVMIALDAVRPFGPDPRSTIVWLMVAVPLGMLVLLVGWGGRVRHRGWECPRVVDGWLFVRGVGPEGLSALARQDGTPAVKRKRKVYPIRLHRLPLAHLVSVGRWNPFQWLWLGFLKVTRSRVLERPSFDWSEGEWREPEAGDPDLVAWWRERVAGRELEAWPVVASFRSDTPNGDTRTEELMLLSPDGTVVAVPGVIRFANGRIFLERYQVNFRSWTVDGRTLATGDRPLPSTCPDDVEMRRASGGVAGVWAAHRQRAGDGERVAVDAAGLRRRLEVEMEARQRVLQEAAIAGPVEEVEQVG